MSKWHPEMGGGEMPRPAETWDDVIDGMIRSAPAPFAAPMRGIWRDESGALRCEGDPLVLLTPPLPTD